MNRSGRTRTCTLADARMRLGSASEFLAAADVLAAGPVSFSNDVLAANAIDAAIAAAEYI